MVWDRVVFRCLGLFWVVVMKGRLIFVWFMLESLILVFLVVLVNCCRVCLFLWRLMFLVFWNLLVRKLIIFLLKLFFFRWVFLEVVNILNIFFFILRMEMLKVLFFRLNIRMVLLFFLFRL